MNNQGSHLKKCHIPFQFLDLDTLLVLSIHSTALIILDSDGFVLSSVRIPSPQKCHPSFHYFLGWLKVNEWLTKDYKGRFSLPQFETAPVIQFRSSTYNLVKSQAQLHHRSVFLAALLWVLFPQLYLQRALYNKPSVLHFRICTKWTWSEMSSILVRTQRESPWTTRAKAKTATVLISRSGKCAYGEI